MGRRRRKNNPRRRSLVFEESPVEGGPLALSPVLCAENPVTAASVPILDGHCGVPWVSPQFNGITVASRRRRQTRQRQNANGSHGDGPIRGKCSRKYAALRFLGEPVTSPKPSALKAARSGKPTKDGRVLQEKNVQNGINTSCEDEDVCAEVVRRRVSLRGSGDYKDYRPSIGRRSEFRGRSSHTPADPSLEQPLPSAQRRTPTESTHVCSILRSQTKNSRSQNRSVASVEKGDGKRKGYDSDILLSPLETWAALSSPSERLTTPVTAGVVSIPLRVALFAHSPSGDAFNTSTNDYSPHCDSPNNSLPDIVSRRKRSSRIGSFGEEGNQSHRKTTLPAEKPRRSKRLQDKLKEAMKYLQPGTPEIRGATSVLVSDTPETEYSLTYRQRQRLKGKTCKL